MKQVLSAHCFEIRRFQLDLYQERVFGWEDAIAMCACTVEGSITSHMLTLDMKYRVFFWIVHVHLDRQTNAISD